MMILARFLIEPLVQTDFKIDSIVRPDASFSNMLDVPSGRSGSDDCTLYGAPIDYNTLLAAATQRHYDNETRKK